MTIPSEKLAQSLSVLKRLQEKGKVAFKSAELTRTHRERLLSNGFIIEVIKGWYIPSRPNEKQGESTIWYTAFWEFCTQYLETKFKSKWCLSPEQSINLHIGNWTVPNQLMIRAPKGSNKPVELLHNTSIFELRLELPNSENIVQMSNIRAMCLPTALMTCSPLYFKKDPIGARAALSMLQEPSELIRKLLEGGHSTIAGRLAGGFDNIGRKKTAREIVETMQSAGYKVQKQDPFEAPAILLLGSRERSPYINRLKMMWQAYREPIMTHFPTPLSEKIDRKSYLDQIDDIYALDAYNSLSIEGYQVSEALIEHVRKGNWDPDKDKEHINALAARGYWQTFQAVKKTIEQILGGKNPGQAVKDDYRTWYRELFGPSVTAGIIEVTDLAGYRNRPVYIRQSMHTPPKHDVVRELMPVFFECLKTEDNPAVRVVLAHFIFVYIHPYIDGNGRIGRLLMNTMLAAGGYSWLVIPVEKRAAYMSALECASVKEDIVPFTQFLAQCIRGAF